MQSNTILKDITDFYIGSRDFNGMPVTELLGRQGLPWPELQDSLIQLIKDEKITLTFSSIFINPHIKAFPDLSPSEQIKKLKSKKSESMCAYPTASVIQSVVDVTEYNDRPFTKRLLLGEPQLLPIYFDLTVLERYYEDPRYKFRFYDYGGSISISDSYYASEDIAERDKVFLKTFGLGYDSKKNRVVVVFLYYLSGLSPEHQRAWDTSSLSVKCQMADEYYRNSILGEWVEHGSIYQAFLKEQIVINEMSQLMGRPILFRETFSDDRPKEFSTFLRPTLKNYLNFVHLLDKLLSDNINKDFFQNEVPLEERIRRSDGSVEVRPRGTLTLLDDWLRKKIRAKESVFNKIIKPLKKVRNLRQRPAHRIQEDKFDRKYYDKQDKLIKKVYIALRTIRQLFANHPMVEGYKVPDWLYKGRIKSY